MSKGVFMKQLINGLMDLQLLNRLNPSAGQKLFGHKLPGVRFMISEHVTSTPQQGLQSKEELTLKIMWPDPNIQQTKLKSKELMKMKEGSESTNLTRLVTSAECIG